MKLSGLHQHLMHVEAIPAAEHTAQPRHLASLTGVHSGPQGFTTDEELVQSLLHKRIAFPFMERRLVKHY